MPGRSLAPNGEITVRPQLLVLWSGVQSNNYEDWLLGGVLQRNAGAQLSRLKLRGR